MAAVRIQEAASLRLDEIYRYTRDRWGSESAERNIRGLFLAFEQIETRREMSRPIPAEFGFSSAMSGMSSIGGDCPMGTSGS